MKKFKKPRYWAVVPAAGSGARMNTAMPKQYLPLAGSTVIELTLKKLLAFSAIDKIIVALAGGDEYWRNLPTFSNEKIIIISGGNERQNSVWQALQCLQTQADDEDWILVHDAVRPCLHQTDLAQLIQQLTNHSVGGLLATPIKETLKRADKAGNSIATIDRTDLWAAQTPQMFRFAKLFAAMEYVVNNNLAITDEASALEVIGEKPLLVAGRQDNIKITFPSDLFLAEKILLMQQENFQEI